MIELRDFSDHVREAFAHLDEPAYLRGHPLARLLAAGGQPLSGDAVRRALLASIEALKPPASSHAHSQAWRRYQCLHRRYAEGASQESIAQDCGISTRQARRDHQDALDLLSAQLWDATQTTSATIDWPRTNLGVESGATTPESQSRYDVLDVELLETGFRSSGGRADVREVLTSIVDLVSSLSTGEANRIALSVPSTLCQAAVDRTILRQILISMINYAQVMWPAQRLSLSGEHDVEAIVVTLGVIAPADGIAAPGSRLDLADAQALLAVGQHLADLHGVSIVLGNERASSFIVQLRIPAARPITVLVVDDNPGVARLFERFLHGTGHKLIAARTWQSALRLAQEARPDIITLDVMMPSQDGWDILRQLRTHHETEAIPVVICSVLPERSVALAMGATGFLEKPLTREGLLTALQEGLLSRQTAHPGRS